MRQAAFEPELPANGLLQCDLYAVVAVAKVIRRGNCNREGIRLQRMVLPDAAAQLKARFGQVTKYNLVRPRQALARCAHSSALRLPRDCTRSLYGFSL